MQQIIDLWHLLQKALVNGKSLCASREQWMSTWKGNPSWIDMETITYSIKLQQ